MCGIAGLLSDRPVDDRVLRAMGEAIVHRGPDDGGLWQDGDAGIALVHRRLSILDLSPLGHQPMASVCGRYVIAFNGEIYNHLDLRRELEQAGLAPEGGWRGHSDTETLVAAFAAWGLEATISRTVGMFAIALWDRRQRLLHLVRDRFGEKPLYYGWAAGHFAFASELKAIRALPGFANPLSRRALARYAARTYVPAPLSIYQGLFKLQPGCILTVAPEAAAHPRNEPPLPGSAVAGLQLHPYWSYRDVVAAGLADPVADPREAADMVEAALARAIAGQAIADVPVGAFLSGGIDSSTVVALYQAAAAGPVRTFSIGFEEDAFNEADHARAVARHFGTEHNEYVVRVAEARDVIPHLPAMYDEPFADSSQIPTHLVSRFARGQVTVALSGDGGDELFAGYNRHFAAPRLWQQVSRVPPFLRSAAGATLGHLPPAVWNLARGRRMPNFGAKVQKALRVAGAARSLDDIYASFLDEWVLEGSPVIGGDGGAGAFDLGLAGPDTTRMMYCDAVTYLPDDILCKVDRAAMAVSLETRVPFLDHRLAEAAARVPVALNLRAGRGKEVLRDVLFRHAPPALFDRPKAGFGIPVGEWIRGPLRDWAEHLLDPRRMAQQGWFDAGMVQARWQAHLAGRRDSTPALWAVLMFQAWLDEQG